MIREDIQKKAWNMGKIERPPPPYTECKNLALIEVYCNTFVVINISMFREKFDIIWIKTRWNLAFQSW